MGTDDDFSTIMMYVAIKHKTYAEEMEAVTNNWTHRTRAKEFGVSNNECASQAVQRRCQASSKRHTPTSKYSPRQPNDY